MTAKRPNFLLISTDQQRADHLGCYGARILQTPHIDSLAARGTRLTRAFVAAPVCMPNRASLLTGRMPSLHGVRHNGLDLPVEAVTFADVLRVAGWRTALVGKAHFQCVTSNPPRMARQVDTARGAPIPEARFNGNGRYGQEIGATWCADTDHDLTYPYYGFETVDLAIEHGDQVEGHYSRWLAVRHPDHAQLRGPDNALPGDSCPPPQAWRTAVPEELYSTRYVEEQTRRRLQAFAETPEEPFVLWASFCDPHHPFTPPGRYWDMYDPADVDLPRTFFRTDKPDMPAFLHRQRREGKANLAGTYAIAVDEAEARGAVALTYGMIAMVDDAVGAILAQLESSGLADNTIVIFCSDHGDLMGEYGLIFKGPLHYQSLVRMPLIWADLRHPRARVHEGFVSTVDLPATILQTAGVAPFNGMQGRSFLASDGTPVSTRQGVLIEDEIQGNLPGHDVRGRARTLIWDRWRLTLYDGVAQGHLYDLREDPDESENRWNDPALRTARAELVERLAREMVAHSETSPLPAFAA